MTALVQPIVCLASASPRRRELLAQIGVPHRVMSADVDESVRPGEPAVAYVQRMAREKAAKIWAREQTLPVLAADTSVVLDGVIHGKPSTRAHALEMLEQLSARTHQVLTAVALASESAMAARLSSSNVTFRPLTRAECIAYWETGEPKDKAGAYAIQGLGAVFIEAIHGSYSGVMGLPLFETADLLRSAGLPVWCKMTP